MYKVISEFFISSYDTPLAQRAAYLTHAQKRIKFYAQNETVLQLAYTHKIY